MATTITEALAELKTIEKRVVFSCTSLFAGLASLHGPDES